MSRAEPPVPWVATGPPAWAPYPRKNLYFVGDGMDEVYDYCIWQAHVDGHTTLEGTRVRGTSAFISDILTRTYIKVMLEPEKLDAFRTWRSAEYEVDNRKIHPPSPDPFSLIVRKELQRLPPPNIEHATYVDLATYYVQAIERFCTREQIEGIFKAHKKRQRKQSFKKHKDGP